MRGKTYKAVKEKAPQQASLAEAVTFLKENTRSNFDETVELHVKLGIDPSKSDQIVRGSVQLPSGTPKQKKIAVFTADAKQQEAAKAAGATIVGGDELIQQVIENGTLDADITIAAPDMMPKLAKAARILGPKGLMPNPKTGTVTPEVDKVVQELAAGKLSYKMDQLGNIHEAIGKASWEADKIQANAQALLSSLIAARPASTKGEFIKSATLALTMSPGVKVAA